MTERPPAAEPGRRSRTSRGDEAARRRAKAWRRAAVAVGVVALLLIGGILLLGGDVPGIDVGPDGPDDFSFTVDDVQASPMSDTPRSRVRDTARDAGIGVTETMNELYLRAFVDRGSWGDYGAAFELFDGRAATSAEAEAEILTLGPTASDTYDRVEDVSGSLTIAVLTDRRDLPVNAIADVRFEATAHGIGGRTSMRIVSIGSYFLRQVDGTWRIFAYRVDRDDETVGGSSPTGSPS